MIDWNPGDLAKCIQQPHDEQGRPSPDVKVGGAYLVVQTESEWCDHHQVNHLYLTFAHALKDAYDADFFEKTTPTYEEPKVNIKTPELA